MAVRLSTLAEIKAFSLSGYLKVQEGLNSVDDILDAVDDFSQLLDGTSGDLEGVISAINPFKTVGLARSVRITEDFGTTNQYAIGAPTRPRIVPNNYQVNASIERIQLDTKDLYDYFSSPEYWYSNDVQSKIGVDDYKFYSYFFINDKEKGLEFPEVYALMPRTSSKAINSGSVMIAHNVEMVGFKYSYDDILRNIQDFVQDLIPSFPGR